MDLFSLPKLSAMRKQPMPDRDRMVDEFVRPRMPAIFENVAESLPYMGDWSYDYFKRRLKSIRVQRAAADGMFHYLHFERIPFEQFEMDLARGVAKYALEPLFGGEAPQGRPEHRSMDFDESTVPEFIPPAKFRVSNLYIGPGDNRSLLHFDETHSLLIMVEGRKKFVLFPPTESRRLYPYSIFDIRAIIEGRILDSKVGCNDIDFQRFPKISEASGLVGEIEAGQALFIPAGTWHYILSEGRNVAVNYFWYGVGLAGWLKRPMIDFWVKDQELHAIDALKAVRNFANSRYARATSS